MKITSSLAISFLFFACAAYANDAPPSDASLQELYTLTRKEEAYNSVKAQMDSIITSSMKEAEGGQTGTPERQAILDRMHAKRWLLPSMRTSTLNQCNGSWCASTRRPTAKTKSTG